VKLMCLLITDFLILVGYEAGISTTVLAKWYR
jgi:hypothetical protein